MDLPRVWITAGSNEKLWGDAGTYKTIPYAALPPIEGLDRFGWLEKADGAQYGMTFEHQEDPPLDARVAEAKKAGLTVPPEAVRFLSDPELHSKIPSCTACYFELGAKLTPLPDHDGPERLLRFMHDQQTCYVWYLLLEPKGRHRIVVAWPEWIDEAKGETFEDLAIPRELREVAPSFEEFIKRFFIENTIWFAANKGKPFEPEHERYADAARGAVARGLLVEN
jgi:hypothetical protein